MSTSARWRSAVELQPHELRASVRIWTRSLPRTGRALYLVSFEGMSAESGGRTRACTGFEPVASPVGLPRHGSGCRNRTCVCTGIQSPVAAANTAPRNVER
jgi:hypothetical protein